MAGTISSCGFARGDRFVVGSWQQSPIGPTIDVMWAAPDGTRTLLAPDGATASFVSSVYGFDRVLITPFEALSTPSSLDLRAGPLELHLRTGGRVLTLPHRPLWFTRRIERPIARALLGVETWGTSPTGVQEWYQATACRFVTTAEAELTGMGLGPKASLRPACRFGFSESPARPTIVEVRPVLGVDRGWLRRLPARRSPTPLW